MTARVLFVLTSHAELGGTGRPTGFHLGETVTPWAALRKAGHAVEFASVAGGRAPMIGYDPDDAGQAAFLADPDGGGRLGSATRVEEVDPAGLGAVYFVGGHGTMWDFRGRPALERLTRQVHEQGGVLAAICHGPAALVDVTLADGRYLVDGLAVTAFSHQGETERGLDGVVPFSLQHALEERGAVYSCAEGRQAHVVVDGRVVTGQNPASAAGLGRAMVELLA